MGETAAPVTYAQPCLSPISGETVTVYGYSARPDGETRGRTALSNVQPVWQFVLLQFCSFGLYDLFWFYNTWSLLKKRHQLEISPGARAIFQQLFAVHLSREIYKLAKDAGVQPSWSPAAIGWGYICSAALARGSMRQETLLPYLIGEVFFVVSLAVRIPLVNALNEFWRREQPGWRERTLPSAGAWVVIVLGGLLWSATVLGLLTDKAGG